MIEDTSFVVDLLRGDERATQLLAIIEAERRPEKVSAVTVLELYEGVRQSDAPETEQRRVLSVLDSKHVVAADHAVMRRAGTISGDLYSAGTPVDREDCVVAATALQAGEPVVTRNADHFRRVDGLEVRTY